MIRSKRFVYVFFACGHQSGTCRSSTTTPSNTTASVNSYIHLSLFLIIIVVVIKFLWVVDARHHAIRLLGDGFHYPRPMRADSLALKPVPEFLHVEWNSHLLVIVVRPFQHEKLAKQLESIRHAIVVAVALRQLRRSGRSDSRNLRQVSGDCSPEKIIHGVVRDARASRIVSLCI